MLIDSAAVENIVRKIVKQILTPPEKLRALILASEKEAATHNIADFLPNNYQPVFIAERGWEQVLSPMDESFDIILLPYLSCTAMADIAVGRASGKVSKAVLSLLLQGKTVSVIHFEYKTTAKNAAAPLLTLYDSYEKTLAGYGLIAYNYKAAQLLHVEKRLITEQEIDKLAVNGVQSITIHHDAILTALATDLARKHTIEIQRLQKA